ncbi:MAG: spermidine/putrescine ABC transporter substrate-binding protein [Bryobacterales bacterium]|jgi:spermidine/putrescine transport system substrate-binding protein|nr:spermidine/putrescine ABC transporter substrate-binding protein [Bryobacterales bacterium]
MKRRTFFLGLAGLAGCTRQQKPRLNVYIWSEYIAPSTLETFAREFGVHLHHSIYESNEELLAKVFSGNSGWDVVFPSHYFLKPMRQQGLLAPLDAGRLPVLGNLAAELQHPAWDQSLDWGLPYMMGAAGVVHQQSVDAQAQSWDLLWREDMRGKVTMLDDPADTIGAALLKLGMPLNSTHPQALQAAKEALVAQKRLLRAYLNSEARQQLVAGELHASHLWTTTSLLAMDDSDALAYYYPREGFARYADCAVVLKESTRKHLAHEFLNFLLRPEIAAANAEESFTTTANEAARTLLPQELRDSAALYPDAATLARGQWFEAIPPDAQRLRDRIWTEVKAR